MKRMKKLFALLLAVVMMMGLSVTAFAASGTNDNSGKITIDNAVEGQTYSIYQMLVLESYDSDAEAYAYKVTESWASWLRTQTQYVSVDNQGYVTWVDGADVVAFAKEALAYAQELVDTDEDRVPDTARITPTAFKKADGTSVEFTNLNLGYYLVDSSLGALCSLDTTDSEATIREKNDAPEIDKEAVNDTGESSPSVGDTVNFEITITAQPGAQNYVLHDNMGEGLDLVADSVKAYVGETALDAEDYSVNYAPSHGDSTPCTFEVTFSESYLESIKNATEIVVKYSAVLNEKAVIGKDEVTNEAILDYGDDNHTTGETTTTEVYSFDLVKTDKENKFLDGAQFALYDVETGGNQIPLVKTGEGQYRVATVGEQSGEDFVSAVITTSNGKAVIDGLGTGTYYLEETKAPDGYNKLAARVEVKIDTVDNTATITDGAYVSGGVKVVNETGSLLPSTGGMGTTLIYIAGAVLVIGAGVLLVVRRRMNAEQ